MNLKKITSNDVDANYWRQKSALFIAAHFQKCTRGKLARNAANKNLWIQYNRAAIVIQRSYRIWKQKRLSAEEIRNLILNNPRPIREQVPFSSLIQRAISKRATHEDLVSLWRYVIELRRAHSQYGTNILLKALIEAKSDLARALILVGNMEFSLKNDTDFSKTMKMQLLPSFDGTNSPNSMDPNSIENAGVRSIDVIRALRLRQHTAEYKAQVMSPRHDMMVDILYKSYYSRNHVGSVFGLKKYESFLQKK